MIAQKIRENMQLQDMMELVSTQHMAEGQEGTEETTHDDN